ncbi:MAG TPA: GatB/YqeY domain-containing protein [Candidatus Hydrogenedens sp.]|nr:GatB/YqeY domain-containing protein [Candidatus Hydrogenedens sp.]HOL19157.1 GatB/YqeY domain-containing protein [Candidatus Hydrogenedens sp.]HPP58799.1 GatB/YqeY domain-containing protein [Candidatus Hydrogenedens sp.]
MSIMNTVQEAMKQAMKDRDTIRLETLRMVKSALLLKEKSTARTEEMSDNEAIATLRSEIRKRKDSIEVFKQLGKDEEVAKLEKEISVIEEFLPQQLSREDVVQRVKQYLAEHPDMNHAGKLTGAMKKELGETVDGKLLNEVCRELLGG